MQMVRRAAVVYGVVAAGVIVFQILLALGVPWGEYAMAGASPGRFSAALRVGALVQGALIGLMAAIVLSRAELVLPSWSRAARRLVWVVVGVTAVSFLLNLISPSAGERAIWAPVGLVLVATSFLVARGVASTTDERSRDRGTAPSEQRL